jgi:hypothetical protein
VSELGQAYCGDEMSGLGDVFLMKDKVNEGTNIYAMVLEKASILLSLLIVLAIAWALNLPAWGIGLAVGFSLGPIVYGHYYILYIRPAIKAGKVSKRNTDTTE